MRDDGRYASQYAADHCVCAYCWCKLTQIFDYEAQMWKAVCSCNEAHVGYHHASFRDSEIQKHTMTYLEVKEFYRRSEYAKDFGLTPPLTGAALTEQLNRNRRALGRDDTGL